MIQLMIAANIQKLYYYDLHAPIADKRENDDHYSSNQSNRHWESYDGKAQCLTDTREEVPSLTVWSALTSVSVKEEVLAADNCGVWRCKRHSQAYLLLKVVIARLNLRITVLVRQISHS